MSGTEPPSDSASGPTSPDLDFEHVPVLLDQVVTAFASVPPGWVIDGTLGGAGHATAILEAHPHLSVIGFDRDPTAVRVATERLARFGPRAHVVHAPFDRLHDTMGILRRRNAAPDIENEDVPEGVSGVLLDLGVSSHQLDRAARGFSYRQGGPLDMRMDPTSGPTAGDFVNTADEAEIVRVLRRFADERHAPRIAKAIVASRPIRTTEQLAEVVRDAIPAAARRTGGHPATRAFQGIRIHINDELGQLERALGDAIDLLVPGGRAAVITYHSGEDKIVARRFRDAAADDCVCPPGVGECRCGGAPSITLVPRKAITASDDEVATNPRARSARLRVAEQLGEAV
ncbi:MAG: 16S rRNA (cytosine(1402)-N(4))-methyltransferase RsmH [Acidimicrobiales bacterium]|nr:16S rRNA (cytosine(1402)-N(4))-methyltransferase RsmH [Acidimicrobiales bacterium]